MVATAELLTALETCPRQAFWRRAWIRSKMEGNAILQAGLRAGLLTDRSDFGQCAGEECYALGNEPGLDTSHYDVHSEVVHLAAIADLVTTALRKPQEKPWKMPPAMRWGNDGFTWNSSAYLNPSESCLRRIVLASNWSDERKASETRSYFSLGEVCIYKMPMQQVIVVLGPTRSGKRHSAWTRGYRHPRNKKLRFYKKHHLDEPFKSSWQQVWREDYDDISTHDWLQAMLDDGVLQELCFTVQIDVPAEKQRQHMLNLIVRKMEMLEKLKDLPDEQMTGCDWPKPCIFRNPCHAGFIPQKGLFRRIGR